MVKRKKLKTTYWKLKSTEESSNWLKRAKKPEVRKTYSKFILRETSNCSQTGSMRQETGKHLWRV